MITDTIAPARSNTFARLLLGLSATALLIGGGSVHAQSSPPQAQTSPDAQPLQPREGSPAPEDAIVVTGIRASLNRAQDVKRFAPSNIETITSQDIGKFTDSSVADALQRIPGVSITRNYRGQDQGDGIDIRGLGRDYSITTVNGRELLGNPQTFGGAGRNFDFGAIPPDILGSIVIYKQPTADIPESGLAGEVDQRTIRPLDVRGKGGNQYFGSLTGSAFYSPNRGDITPEVTGVVGGKFLNDTLGAYVAGAHSQEDTLARQLFSYDGSFTLHQADAAGNITTIPNVQGPSGNGFRYNSQDLKRDSVAAGLQWRPDSHFEANADFLYYKFEIDLFERNSDFIGPGFSGQFNNGVIQPGGVQLVNNDIVYFDTSKIVGGGTSYQRAGYLDERAQTDAYNYGINLAWHDDNGFKISGDGSYGTSDHFENWHIAYGTNAARGGENAIFDERNLRNPTLTFSAPPASNPSDPNSYTFEQGLFALQSLARNERYTAQVDLQKSFNDRINFKAGARYTETSSSYILLIGPTTGEVNSTGFFNGVDLPPNYSIGIPRGDQTAICANNPTYCNNDNRGKGSFSTLFPTSATGSPGDNLPFSPGSSYFVREKKIAAYAQVDGNYDLGGIKLLGNLGVRAVNLDTFGKAFQGVSYRVGSHNGAPTPGLTPITQLVTDTSSYWRYLPSLNITARVNPQLQVRFGVAQTISPAQYSQLAPIGTAEIYTPDVTGGALRSVITTGNVRLKPTTSTNYDVTAEYYNHSGGAFIASVFYKDVSDVIVTSTVPGTVPGQGATIFDVSSTSNASSGRIFGVEIGFNQPLTFLPGLLGGLGVQGNYTYAYSRVTDPVLGPVPFVGSSRHNVNASVYYDRAGYNVRFSGFYKTDEFENDLQSVLPRYITPQFSFDLSVSKKLFDHLELRANFVNLTGRDVTEVLPRSGRVDNFYERPRTFLVGARLSY